MKTPIAFLIFNRPDTTARVFEAIRQAQPPKLLVIADGPRADRPGEPEMCQAARSVIHRVDWPCEILTNFSDINLGCKRRVSSGLDWVFNTVEEAIILEDDCLPHPTFFRFCEELLTRYRDDGRVMMISGNNFQFGRRRTEHSYYFSRYVHIWGWASWSRAWKFYDVNMGIWPEIRDGSWLRDIFPRKRIARYWGRIFDQVFHGEIDTWDYQWTFACLVQNGLIVLPNHNLVSNIGFGSLATHVHGKSCFANMRTEPMLFPLSHPQYMLRDERADAYTDDTQYALPFLERALNRWKR